MAVRRIVASRSEDEYLTWIGAARIATVLLAIGCTMRAIQRGGLAICVEV